MHFLKINKQKISSPQEKLKTIRQKLVKICEVLVLSRCENSPSREWNTISLNLHDTKILWWLLRSNLDGEKRRGGRKGEGLLFSRPPISAIHGPLSFIWRVLVSRIIQYKNGSWIWRLGRRWDSFIYPPIFVSLSYGKSCEVECFFQPLKPENPSGYKERCKRNLWKKEVFWVISWQKKRKIPLSHKQEEEVFFEAAKS